MSFVGDDDFWEDLLSFVEEGRVIPVIGQGVVTTQPDQEGLYPWLATQLAEKLQISTPDTADDLTLNEVVCRHLLAGGQRNVIYTRLSRILRDSCPRPGQALLDLAEIRSFRLFISATFDPLMEMAINEVRHGGHSLTEVAAYSPNAEVKDIPARHHHLAAATVFHILGKVSPSPDYVVWEEDALEFICGLQQHMPVMENLARDLKDHGLLVLGLNFSDWLVRFFLRVAKQTRFSDPKPHMEVIADTAEAGLSDSLVMFFGSVSKNVHVVSCNPSEFAAELCRRWKIRNLKAPEAGNSPASFQRSIPDGAIFISYAREDTEAVIQLKERIESFGCSVWFDQERNQMGDDFSQKMEKAVKKQASVFLSVISRNSEEKGVAWCHRERRWAAERAEFFSEGETFYVPVRIDEVNLPPQREPAKFASIHVNSCIGGDMEPDVCEYLRDLQKRNRKLMGLE